MKAEIQRAAEAVRRAAALLIGAGAGMGVDSGLPDFRGTKGFWNAYPPFAKLGLRFVDLANPRWFRTDPQLAWGFYGQRRNLYRATPPHAGFGLLRKWAGRMKHGCFVFTSNVDGHFQKAGFEPQRIVEVHGSLDWLQCTGPCGRGIFPAPQDPGLIVVDEATMRAQEPLPSCPGCGRLARPNVLMFGDWDWEETRTAGQQDFLVEWLRQLGDGPLVIVECGAGEAVPTVRRFCEQVTAAAGATLIRINPRDPEVPPRQISLPLAARAALEEIDRLLV